MKCSKCKKEVEETFTKEKINSLKKKMESIKYEEFNN